MLDQIVNSFVQFHSSHESQPIPHHHRSWIQYEHQTRRTGPHSPHRPSLSSSPCVKVRVRFLPEEDSIAKCETRLEVGQTSHTAFHHHRRPSRTTTTQQQGSRVKINLKTRHGKPIGGKLPRSRWQIPSNRSARKKRTLQQMVQESKLGGVAQP